MDLVRTIIDFWIGDTVTIGGLIGLGLTALAALFALLIAATVLMWVLVGIKKGLGGDVRTKAERQADEKRRQALLSRLGTDLRAERDKRRERAA